MLDIKPRKEPNFFLLKPREKSTSLFCTPDISTNSLKCNFMAERCRYVCSYGVSVIKPAAPDGAESCRGLQLQLCFCRRLLWWSSGSPWFWNKLKTLEIFSLQRSWKWTNRFILSLFFRIHTRVHLWNRYTCVHSISFSALLDGGWIIGLWCTPLHLLCFRPSLISASKTSHTEVVCSCNSSCTSFNKR